jgi:hypothetical protein
MCACRWFAQGELTRSDGSVKVRGTVAYVPQNAWIQSGTVKDNITFGFPFDQAWYDAVIDACALTPDIAILPDGDESEVGEKGLSLSGGQKARLYVHRSCLTSIRPKSYADRLLEPSTLKRISTCSMTRSALSISMLAGTCSTMCLVLLGFFVRRTRHTGDERLLMSTAASKGRLLCTNAIPYIRQADDIVLLRNGAIIERSRFSDIKESTSEIAKLLAEFGQQAQEASEDTDSDRTLAEDEAPQGSAADLKAPPRALRRKSSLHQAAARPVVDHKAELLKELKKSSKRKGAQEVRVARARLKQVSEASPQHREQGSVKRDIYRKYIEANGVLGVRVLRQTT